MQKTIALYTDSEEFMGKTQQLAENLQLPIATANSHYDYLLNIGKNGISLQKTQGKLAPLMIDFLSPQLQFRQQKVSLKNEILARALGLKKAVNPVIVDATGGLARDSFIIASLGFAVTLLERSPIIYTLIADALSRASHNPAIQRMHLIHTDAISWLKNLKPEDKPDIIYLDPMFEERKKTALPKKEMLIFHDIVGDDIDANELFTMALACAKQRVVVKRARLAEPLNQVAPAFSTKGSSSRFDVYLI